MRTHWIILLIVFERQLQQEQKMKVAVLGTGQVGSAVGGKLAALGHEVRFGSRAPQSDKAQALAASTGSTVTTYAKAAAHGDWVVNALQGESAIPILEGCDIAGKILIDIANYDSAVDQPIDEPLGLAIQRTFPEVRLVKALNSISAHLMVDPGALGADHCIFLAGNDAEARGEVARMLGTFGWNNILDLGDLGACRAMEQLIPLWMRLEQIFDGPDFNLAVIRPPAG